MAEHDIKKTTLRAGSLGLYEFIHIPVNLSNAGSSFCSLMDQCLGDHPFLTLLLCLDDICIIAPDISAMVDWVMLVLSQLKELHLKMKPNFPQSYQHVVGKNIFLHT